MVPARVTIPSSTQILVIGGGPGGSYTASVLARDGYDVVLLEADKFPRYHIGESQIASLRHFLRFIELEDAFENFGFQKKVGAGFKLNQHKKEGYSDFVSFDPKNYSWNVVRSEMDEMMLRHASKSGAKVFEETKVISVSFEGDSTSPSSYPTSATYQTRTGTTGTISFDYLVDASGRAGILTTKYLKNREFNKDLANVASWGYFRGTEVYRPGTDRENSPFFEALTDETGWAWFIPLHDGTTSVGVVSNQAELNAKKSLRKEKGEDVSSKGQFLSDLKLAPSVLKLIGQGELVKKSDDIPLIGAASDYSYIATAYAGNKFRIVGDAAAFIDPFFSSGCHLAVSGGLSAAATISAVIRGDCIEDDAIRWHTSRTEISYTRFLLIVLSAYRQMRAQRAPVLASEQEDNFDTAFEHFRPIIQGTSDAGIKFKDDDLPQTIEFIAAHAFESGTPEEAVEMMKRYGNPLHKPPRNEAGDSEVDKENKKILKRIAVWQLMKAEDTIHIQGFVSDNIHGRKLRLERGSLGLDIV